MNTRITDFFHKVETSLEQSIKTALHVTVAIDDFLNNTTAQVAEDVICAVIPQGRAWTAAATLMANEAVVALTAISNPSLRQGILQRAAAEIAAIIHGNVHPQGISGYVYEIQKVFVGETPASK